MTKTEIRRLVKLEDCIRSLAEEFGLKTTDVIFEVVPSQRMLEGMAYMFPMNYSHWSFGRDYEKYRTIYEHTGAGIPYEQVWNFEKPRAFLVETNPFTLNAMVMAHVFGHVDFFLENLYLRRGRDLFDVAQGAKNAAKRFAGYEEKYGKAEVEKIIDAAMSIMWHENPDPFFEEQDEEVLRERLLQWQRAKLERCRDLASEFKKPENEEEIRKAERNLEHLISKTPPEQTYDLLLYVIRHSPKPLKPWMEDILTVVRSQARALSPNRRTKMLNEGWATYWHVKIMRKLFERGFLTAEEHGTYNDFHAGITAEHKKSFNWYRVGLAFFENVKERWDRGRFGRDYDECADPYVKANYDTRAGLGDGKIFEIRSFYSDRMAVENLFADEFINEQRLYIYREHVDSINGEITDVISEDNPEIIRAALKSLFTFHGIPLIVVEDGNYHQIQKLYLKHVFSGYEIDPEYRNKTLSKIFNLWNRAVLLEAVEDGKLKLFSFDGKDVRSKDL